MKKLLLIILLISAFSLAKAQTDYCKELIQVTEKHRAIYYASKPDDPSDLGMDSFIKIVEIGRVNTYFKFGIILPDFDRQATTSDATIIFEDGETLNYPGVAVKTAKNVLGNCFYYTLLPVSEQDMLKFKSKLMAYYKLVDTKRIAVASRKIVERAFCIDRVGTVAAGVDPNFYMTKKYDDMKNITSYQSSQTESIQVIKTIDSNGPSTTLMFHIYKGTIGNNQQIVYVKFNDGQVVNFPSSTIYGQTDPSEYLYSCTITLNSDNIKNFKDKKIVKFQIADVDVLVNDVLGTDVNAWINSLDSLK